MLCVIVFVQQIEVSVKNEFFTREFVPYGDKCRRLRERHRY